MVDGVRLRARRPAASASCAFASVATSTRCMNQSSWAEIDATTAPPCVRRAIPWRSSSARSRGAVMGDTPNRRSTSVRW